MIHPLKLSLKDALKNIFVKTYATKLPGIIHKITTVAQIFEQFGVYIPLR